MQIHGDYNEVVPRLHALGCTNETFLEGVEELSTVLKIVSELSPANEVVADMMIVRGLDYYTGTVFETIAPEYRDLGSICSGGRYENLANHYTDQALPGVGGSIGLTRLFAAFVEAGLVKASSNKPVDVCLLPISSNEYAACAKFAQALREQGKTVDLVLTQKKLGDKLKYASRVAQFAAVIGETEATTGKFALRNLDTGAETEISLFA